MKHHIWCNEQNPLRPDTTPEEGCAMCKSLRHNHPEREDDPTGEKLMKKYFPNNVLVKPK